MAAEKIKHVRMNNPHGIEFSLSNGKVIKVNGNATWTVRKN
jgi:hypothetical protein